MVVATMVVVVRLKQLIPLKVTRQVRRENQQIMIHHPHHHHHHHLRPSQKEERTQTIKVIFKKERSINNEIYTHITQITETRNERRLLTKKKENNNDYTIMSISTSSTSLTSTFSIINACNKEWCCIFNAMFIHVNIISC